MTDRDAVRALARVAHILERASSDLSMAHYRVLAAVSAGDERASRVATRLALGKPAISASVDSLCRRGFLTRESVANDQRAVSLHVTPSGTAALRAAEDAMAARLDDLLSHTARPADTRAALVRLAAGAEEFVAARRSRV